MLQYAAKCLYRYSGRQPQRHTPVLPALSVTISLQIGFVTPSGQGSVPSETTPGGSSGNNSALPCPRNRHPRSPGPHRGEQSDITLTGQLPRECLTKPSAIRTPVERGVSSALRLPWVKINGKLNLHADGPQLKGLYF